MYYQNSKVLVTVLFLITPYVELICKNVWTVKRTFRGKEEQLCYILVRLEAYLSYLLNNFLSIKTSFPIENPSGPIITTQSDPLACN